MRLALLIFVWIQIFARHWTMSCTPLRPLYANRASSFSRNTRNDPWLTVLERPSRSSQCRTINPDNDRNSQGARLRLSLLPVAVRSTHW
ncbi:hypothetical protein Plhal304r1_c021g0075621 [Plasmopara halstedii]